MIKSKPLCKKSAGSGSLNFRQPSPNIAAECVFIAPRQTVGAFVIVHAAHCAASRFDFRNKARRAKTLKTADGILAEGVRRADII